MRTQIIACLILTILATSDVQTSTSATDLVKFDSAPFIMGKIQQRQPRERGEMPTNEPDAIEAFSGSANGRSVAYFTGWAQRSMAAGTGGAAQQIAALSRGSRTQIHGDDQCAN